MSEVIPCPTCNGGGTVTVPDPITEHVCGKYCGNFHQRYSHAMWKDREGVWTVFQPILSMSNDGKGEFSINLARGSWPFISEKELRQQFRFMERKTGKVVEGADADLSFTSPDESARV